MTKTELFNQVVGNLQKVHNKTDLTPFEIVEVILEAGFHLTKQTIMQLVLSGDDKHEVTQNTIHFVKRISDLADEIGKKTNQVISKEGTNAIDVALVLVTIAHQLFTKINETIDEETDCDCENCSNKCESKEEPEDEKVSGPIAALLKKLQEMDSDKDE